MHKLLLSFALIFACTPEENEEEHGEETGEEGTPSGAECDSTITYENFGAAFMDSYCTSCHSSTLSGAGRNGAPDGHDFDTLAGIVLVVEHVDENAAAGPDSTNDQMPLTDPKPTLEERQMLGAWLACDPVP